MVKKTKKAIGGQQSAVSNPASSTNSAVDVTVKPTAEMEAGKSKIAPTPKASLIMIEVNAVVVKDNARSSMDEDSLFQLADSVKSVGQLEPVIVHKVGKKLVMIAGHRRLAAAKQNKEYYIEAKVYNTLDDAMVARMQLTENLQREDLNHIDIARQLGVARDAGMTNAQIAAEINTSDDYVRKHLDLLRLTQPVANLVASGRLPVKQAELIARVGDPKQQIALAGQATGLYWFNEEKGWVKSGVSIAASSAGDYIQPMNELRLNVGMAMQGLAACGWPMGEKFAGKRPCEGCPDNTATYADQPMLFAGISPRGSAKKGHCTNEACYKAKAAEQNKVRAARKKEAEKKLTAKVAKAKKAGLAVCEGCTKVVDSVEDLTDVQGRRLCTKCVEKQQKKTDRDYGEDSYIQRQIKVNALKKKFPWNAEQKFAVALHGYGMELAEAIEKSLEVFAAPEADRIILLAVISGEFWMGEDDWKLMPLLKDLIGDGQFDAKALAMLWDKANRSNENKPGVDYSGKAEDVPLPDVHVEYIGELEALAEHWGVKNLPNRPTMKGIEHDEIVKTILKGKRNDAVAAIAACEDAELLWNILRTPGTGKIAAWRIKVCQQRVEQLEGPAPSKDSAVASPICQGEAKRSPKEKKKKPTKKKATKKKAKANKSKPSRVNESGVLTDTERIEVKVPGTKRAGLSVRVALAPNGYWYRGISVAVGCSGFSYSPSIQKGGHESRQQAIVEGLHEIANRLRDVADRGTASKAGEVEITKAIAAVQSRLADFEEPDPASSKDSAGASEQLGRIDKDTPLGRKFEVKNLVGEPRELTLIKRLKKEYTFLNNEGKLVKVPIASWEAVWMANCTGYTDPTGDHGIISDGPKELALIHIAVANLSTLKHADMVGVKGDWRRAAVRKQIEKLEKEQATDGEEKEK